MKPGNTKICPLARNVVPFGFALKSTLVVSNLAAAI